MEFLHENPLVTAIICSYNGNDRIQAAIRSVFSQTYANLELVVIDDGSEVSLAAALSGFQDNRLRFFRFEKNQGLHAARAFAAKQARGEFIALLDDDDYWLPQKIEKQMAIILTNSETGLVCTASKDIFPGGRNLTRYPPSRKITYLQEAVYECTIASSVLFRRCAYEKVGGFDSSFRRCGDWECWIRLARAYEICALMEPLVVTRMRDKSLQRSGDIPAFAIDRFAVLKKHEVTLKSEGLWNEALSWQYHSVGVRLFAAKNYRDARKWFAKAALKRPRVEFLLHYGISLPVVSKLYPVAKGLCRFYKYLIRSGCIK